MRRCKGDFARIRSGAGRTRRSGARVAPAPAALSGANWRFRRRQVFGPSNAVSNFSQFSPAAIRQAVPSGMVMKMVHVLPSGLV